MTSTRQRDLPPGLADCSLDWRYIPIDGDKRPINPNTGRPLRAWGEKLYDFDGIAYVWRECPKVQAIGVVLGPPSGLMAVDFDGEGSGSVFRDVTGHEPTDLPRTVGWTSGLPYRGQLGFTVPREYWPLLRGRRSFRIEDPRASRGHRQVLEFRWAGHQSVIAGAHPDTDGYRWIERMSPKDIEPAEAPHWLLEVLLKPLDEDVAAEYTGPRDGDAEIALDLLEHIPLYTANDYDSWLSVGMALHSVDSSDAMLDAWERWSRGDGAVENYQPGATRAKWKSFGNRTGVTIGTLYWLASRAGYKPAKRRQAAPPPPSPEPSRPQPEPEYSEDIDDEETLEPVVDLDREIRRDAARAHLSNAQATIDLADVFHPRLADLLIRQSIAFPLSPVWFLGPCLTTAAAMIGTRARVEVKRSWREPLVIWAGNVAEASAMKSAASNVFQRGLVRMEIEERNRWRRESEDHAKGGGEGPPPAPPARFFVLDATYEGVTTIAAQNTGIVSLQDELSAWFANLERACSASARSGWLSLWGGSAIIIDRKTTESLYAAESAVSLFGNVQPDKLVAMMESTGDGADSSGDGLWARFLWVRPARNPFRYAEAADDVSPEIRRILERLRQTPIGLDEEQPTTLRFEREAIDAMVPFWEAWDQEAFDSSSAARRAFLGKLRGYSVRLAGILAALDAACEAIERSLAMTALYTTARVGTSNRWELPVTGDHADRALRLSLFFLAQFDALQDDLGQGELPANVAKLVARAKAAGGGTFTLRQVMKWKLPERDSTARQTLEWLRFVSCTLGIGKLRIGGPRRRDQTTWELGE